MSGKMDIIELNEEGGKKSSLSRGSPRASGPCWIYSLLAFVIVVLLIVIIALAAVIAQRPILYQNAPTSPAATTPTVVPSSSPTASVPDFPVVPLVTVGDVLSLTLSGSVAGGSFGDCFTSTDVNSDGFSDLLIGAPDMSAVYLVLGYQPAFAGTSASISMPPASGKGSIIYGVSVDDQTGDAVATGDVDNDGIVDVVLNSQLAGPAQQGTVSVLYGSPFLYSTDKIYLPPANTTIGFTVQGPSSNAGTGAGLFAEDIDGDGYADLVIGCPNATIDGYATFPGATYLIWGGQRTSFPSTLDLANLAIQHGSVFVGGANNDQLGFVTATVGDINKDGYNDFAMSAPTYNGNHGAVYIVFGGPRSKFPARIDVYSLPASLGFVVQGRSGDNFGQDLSLAGDVNNDGYADIISGNPSDPSLRQPLPGSVAIIFGGPTDTLTSFSASDFNGVNGFLVTGNNPGDQFGFAVGPAGDYNLDGAADYNVGATGVTNGQGFSGAVYVIYGHTGAFNPNVQISNWNQYSGIVFTANQVNSNLGIEVWGNFDFNGDGRADFGFGKPDEIVAGVGESAGQAVIIFN